jgi:hypothetical protein
VADEIDAYRDAVELRATFEAVGGRAHVIRMAALRADELHARRQLERALRPVARGRVELEARALLAEGG